MFKTMSRVLLILFIVCFSLLSARADQTYTLDADFNKGTSLNVNQTISNQLQLNQATAPFPFINIAASNRGTIVRIDVNTGAILGEYLTSPNGMGRNPSRTTVDQLGNVWVANRDEYGWSGNQQKGSVARVGLIIGGIRVNVDGTPNVSGQYLKAPFQYNTCIDKNGDGLIKTSRGLGNILSWTNAGSVDTHGGIATAEDECILNYTRVAGTGTRTVAVDANNDLWTGGADTDHEKISGITGLPIPGAQFRLGCGGYGGLLDANGVLWSARFGSNAPLRFDTTTMTGACLGTKKGDYGLGIDPSTGEIWHTYLTGNKVAKLSPNGTVLAYYSHGDYYAQGVVVDNQGNVWIAHSLHGNSIGHLRTNGAFIGNITIPGGAGPTGVAVDANGKIWAANYNGHNVVRIDPNAGPIVNGVHLGAIDLTVNLNATGLAPAYPYNYSDMTGFVAIGTTSPQGAWTVVHDSGIAGNAWGKILWNTEPQGNVPLGTEIVVQARAADLETDLSGESFVPVSNAANLSLIGRFIEIQAILKTTVNGATPVLSDLTVQNASKPCDVNQDGAINVDDINLISANRGTQNTIYDIDKDGFVTTNDSRQCTLVCDKARCAR